MKSKLTFLFLFTEVADYFLSCIEYLKDNYSINITFVYIGVDANAPFSLENYSFETYKLNEFENYELFENFCINVNPNLIYVSGWTQEFYLKVCKKFKKNRYPIVCGLDNPWKGNLKQIIASFISPFFQKKYFSHLWVAGQSQERYAKKMGFKKGRIIKHLYCANLSNFQLYPLETKYEKSQKTLLYVGRLVPYKGIIQLYEEFKKMQQENILKDWSLLIVGNGPLDKTINETNRIKKVGFLQPKDLVEVGKKCNAFILPSFSEAWGVVVQEFAAMGLPIITSIGVNSSELFVESDVNGFIFDINKKGELRETLIKLFSLSDIQLQEMQKESLKLSTRITPDIWCKELLSVIDCNK